MYIKLNKINKYIEVRLTTKNRKSETLENTDVEAVQGGFFTKNHA